MRWTKVRKLIKESFAESVRTRVDVRVTNADQRGTSWQDTCKEGTIVVDGVVVAHIDPHSIRKLTVTLPIPPTDRGAREIVVFAETYGNGRKMPAGAQPLQFLDFPEACWDYLNSNLNESLRSEDPFVSALAVLNAKVGMQRLRRTATQDLNPLTRAMLDFRMRAEREHRAAAKRTTPQDRDSFAKFATSMRAELAERIQGDSVDIIREGREERGMF